MVVLCTRALGNEDTSAAGPAQAAAELRFPESDAGYAQLRQRLEQIARRQGPVHSVIRIDTAGKYADNLPHFLDGLGGPAPATGAEATAAQTRPLEEIATEGSR